MSLPATIEKTDGAVAYRRGDMAAAKPIMAELINKNRKFVTITGTFPMLAAVEMPAAK